MSKLPEISACPTCPSSAQVAGQTEGITWQGVWSESWRFALKFGFVRTSTGTLGGGIDKKLPSLTSSF